MDALLTFFSDHGLWIGLIALAGIVLLGVLKYCKVFKGIENATYRKLTYLLCSVGFSLIGCVIYMLCTSSFDWVGVFPLAAAIWTLNQTFYNIFKTTQLNDLAVKVMNWIIELIKTKTNIDTDTTEKTEE